MRSTRTELLASYEKSKTLGHKGLRGTAREQIIDVFLQRSFPKKFVVGSGEIFDAQGLSSPQADIVVYDESLPILHHGPGVSQFLAEGVLAHIEVKTALDKATLLEALTLSGSVKKLTPGIEAIMHMGELRTRLPSFAIAYTGPTAATFKQNVMEYYANPSNLGQSVDGIFVLEQGYAAVLDDEGKTLQFGDWGEDVLLVAFMKLYRAFWKNWTAYPNFTGYVAGVKGTGF